MKIPILVNIGVPIINNNGNTEENITQAIIDFDCEKIAAITKCHDGTSYYEYNDGRTSVKILILFIDSIRIYEEQHRIDDRYKEEVRAYSKDNFISYRDTNEDSNT